MEGDNLISDCESAIKRRQGIERIGHVVWGPLGWVGFQSSKPQKNLEKSISAKAQNCFGST